MRLADYVIESLADNGLDTAFLVTGGAAMHLNDALAGEPRIRCVCCHHEQAAAIAAEGYARIAGRPGLVQVTAGPGSINAMTGVFGAYVDSIPMVVVSGQSKRELLRSTYQFGPGVRQLGEQEVDSVTMAAPITKHARQLTDPSRIRFELEKSLFLATAGRPGPVWLDIPSDVQGADVDPLELPPFTQAAAPDPDLGPRVRALLQRWRMAERPLLVVGPGVREGGAVSLFRALVRQLDCPVVVAGPEDALATTDDNYAGRLGVFGSRAGNMTVQEADLILFLGVRFYVHLVSYDWAHIGRHAYKICVEEDPAELEKPTFIGDECICAELAPFLSALLGAAEGFSPMPQQAWLEWCRHRNRLLPPVSSDMRTVSTEGAINPYWFMEELFHQLRPDDIIVTGNASSALVSMQAGQTRPGQRIFSNQGCGAMGYGLPAAVGAAVAARRGERVICLDGDGSLMMNLQELQTVAQNALRLVVVVINNGGYASIQQTQQGFFGRLIGCDEDHGLSFPDFTAIAQACGIQARRVRGDNFAASLAEALSQDGPLLVDAVLDGRQGYEPKITSTRRPDGTFVSERPDNMSPFLAPDELDRYRFDPRRTVT